jgi:hypothetical protein
MIRVSVYLAGTTNFDSRRVEDDMRPLVRAATQTARATIRSAARKEDAEQKSRKSKGRATLDAAEDGAPTDKRKDVEREKEFQTVRSSAPRRLNDIVQAPPDLSKLPRLEKRVDKGAIGKAGRTPDGVLSMAQRVMLEKEREIAIQKYRQMKATQARADG